MLTINNSSTYTSRHVEHPESSKNVDNHHSIMEKLCSNEKKTDEFHLMDINEAFPSLQNKEGQELTELLKIYMDGKSPSLTSLTFSRFDKEDNLIAITTISAEKGDTSNLSFQHTKLNYCGKNEGIYGSLNNCNETPLNLFLTGDKLIIKKIDNQQINMCDGYGGDAISPKLREFLSEAKVSSEIINENELFGKLFSTSVGETKEFSDWIKYSYLNSATARKLINHAALDNTRWDVIRDSKEFKTDLTNKVIYIPDDYSFKKSKFQAARYYLHELAHRCTGLPDQDGTHNTGPIVQLVNKIMNELGTDDVRLEYENIRQCSESGMVGMFKVDKERIRTIEEIKEQAIYWHGDLDSPEAKYFINMAMAESFREMEKYKREGRFSQEFKALTLYKEEQEQIRRTERENYYLKQEAGKAALKSRERAERDVAMEQRGIFNILTDIVNPLSGYVNAFLDSLNTLTAKEMSTNILSLTQLGELLRSKDEMYFADIIQRKNLIHEVRGELKELEEKDNLSTELNNISDAITELEAALNRINEDKERIAKINKELAKIDAKKNECSTNENEGAKSDSIESDDIIAPSTISREVSSDNSDLAQKDNIIIHLYYHGDVPRHILSNIHNTVMNNPNNTVMLWVDDKARECLSGLQDDFRNLDIRDSDELKDVKKEGDEKAFSNIKNIFSYIDNSSYEDKVYSRSDLSRLIATYKYGGLYLDADVVVNDELKSNDVFGDSEFRTHISINDSNSTVDVDFYDALGFKNKEDNDLGSILEELSSDYDEGFLVGAEQRGELVRIAPLVQSKLEKYQEKLNTTDIDFALSEMKISDKTMRAIKEISISESLGDKITFRPMRYSGDHSD